MAATARHLHKSVLAVLVSLCGLYAVPLHAEVLLNLTTQTNQRDQVLRAIEARLHRAGFEKVTVSSAESSNIVVTLPDETQLPLVHRLVTAHGETTIARVLSQAELATIPHRLLVIGDNRPIEVEAKPSMSGELFEEAHVEIDFARKSRLISLRIKGTVAAQFKQLTTDNIGRQIAIIIDDTVITTPVISTGIDGPTVQITSSDSLSDMQVTAALLASPPLPAPVRVLRVDVK